MPQLPSSARQQITNVGFIGSTGYNYTQDFVKEFMVPRILNEGAQTQDTRTQKVNWVIGDLGTETPPEIEIS